MQLIWLSLMLAFQAAETGPTPGASYSSDKSLPVLQRCLTDKLARIGDVSDLHVDGVTTLMLRNGPEGQVMVIDIAPPSVKVTTRFVYGTRKLIESCL